MKRKLFGALVALLLLLLPLLPGRELTLKVRYAHYACQPCSLGFAYRITQVYQPHDRRLLGQDVVLYHAQAHGRGYFAEYTGLQISDFERPLRILGYLRRRSLYDYFVHTPYEADVYKWVVVRKP